MFYHVISIPSFPWNGYTGTINKRERTGRLILEKSHELEKEDSMKKGIAVLLMAAMTAGIVSGCASSGTGSGTAASGGKETAAADSKSGEKQPESLESGEKTVIEIWCWDPNFNVISAKKAGEIYTAEHPDVEIKVTEVTSNEIYTKMTAAVLGNQQDTLPDIMLMHDKNIKKYVGAYEGVFADLTNSGIDYSQFAEYKVAAGTVDGKIYSVPFDNAAAVTALRTDILEEAGYKIDDFTDITWDDFIEKGKDIYEKTGKSILNERADKPQVLSIMLQSASAWYFDEEGNPYIAENPVIRKSFELYKELVDNHVMARHNDNEAYYQAFWSGEVAGGMNGSYILANIMKEESQSGKWDITNVPKFADVEGATNYGNNGGSSWVVFDGPDKEIAADYLKTTFAGSEDLFNDLLKQAAVISTWMPAKEGENYPKGVEYFSGKPVYASIVEYAEKVPMIDYEIYTSEAQDSVASALTKVIDGEDMDKALQSAQQEVEFAAQQ